MNNFKKKNTLFKIGIATLSIGLLLTTKTWAMDIEAEFSDNYQKWNNLTTEEKQETIMPNPNQVDIPNSVLSKYKILEKSNLVNGITPSIENGLIDVYSATDSRFTLSDKMKIRVENQGVTNECWAFSVLKSLETDIALKSGVTELKDFSERHMDYSSIKTFTDGTNPDSLTREAGDGGLPIVGLAYLTNGKGAVLEEKLPFENNVDKISLSKLNQDVDTIVTDYDLLPTISKSYTRDGNGNTISVKYTNSNGTEYSAQEVEAIRKTIKEYIEKNGAITSFTAGSKSQYYNGTSIFESTAYNCNNINTVRDHAITIVGWDDNYSKDNFKDGNKPSTNGAYIVLNSYGSENFDNGYIYISYEDYFIESELYGVSSSSNVDYKKIYQYDDWGGILKLQTKSEDPGYIGAIYKRDSEDSEILNNVGITLASYANVEIYVNPNGTNMDPKELVYVGKSDKLLGPGYHRLSITPTELTGSNFAIVVKQIAEDNESFSFEVELSIENTGYANVTSENQSYISINGTDWINLKNVNVSGTNMSTADVCIKGFTIEKKTEDNKDDNNDDNNNNNGDNSGNNDTDKQDKFTSNIYKIVDSNIMNITYDTTKEKLLSNIETNLDVKIVDSSENELSNADLIKTGDKIKLSNNKEYVLIVRGDVNCDGKMTLTDVSKIVLYYNGNKGYELTGAAAKAVDMNFDGKFTLTDVSQLVELYNSIKN